MQVKYPLPYRSRALQLVKDQKKTKHKRLHSKLDGTLFENTTAGAACQLCATFECGVAGSWFCVYCGDQTIINQDLDCT